MRYDAEHKAQTRQRVVEVAALAIKKDGPERVGVADVMKRAGLTHGGFYAHFKSKDALVVAAIEHMFEVSQRRWASLGSPGAYVQWYLSPSHRDAKDGQGCALAALSTDLPRLPAKARAAFAAGYRGLLDTLAAGMPRRNLDDARSLLSELVGALALSRVEIDGAKSDALLAASRRSIAARFQIGELS